MANSKYIAKELKNRIIGQPSITQKEIIRILKNKLNVYVSQSMAKRTKARVLDSHTFRFHWFYIALMHAKRDGWLVIVF